MKIIKKVKENLRINKKLFVFLFVLVLIGIASGTLLSLMLDNSDEKLVVSYIENYFNNLSVKEETLLNAIIGTSFLTILIYLLGISIIGFVLILFWLFWKAFVLGFSIGAIINTYGMKGILLAFIYIFPHHIINLFLLIVFSGIALIMSFKIITNLFREKKFDLTGFNKYNKALVIVLVIGCLTAIYEILVMPNILLFILNIFKW